MSSAFASREFAVLDEDPSVILALLKALGKELDSLPNWLRLQDYVVSAFDKFGTDIAPLRQYSQDMVAPLEYGSN